MSLTKEYFLNCCSNAFDTYMKDSAQYVMGTIKNDKNHPLSLMIFEGDIRHHSDIQEAFKESYKKYKENNG